MLSKSLSFVSFLQFSFFPEYISRNKSKFRVYWMKLMFMYTSCNTVYFIGSKIFTGIQIVQCIQFKIHYTNKINEFLNLSPSYLNIICSLAWINIYFISWKKYFMIKHNLTQIRNHRTIIN